jgi:DNA polymerase I-like protein with 3'-5' exonuclease and polymerase domains
MIEKIFIKTQRELNAAIKRLLNEPAIGFDTETSGLDAYVGKVWSIQIGVPGYTVLIPLNGKKDRFDLSGVAKMFADASVVKIAHNAAFDIKVVWSLGLEIENVHCTRNAEALLNAGLFIRNDLASTLKRRFGVDLSKDERKDFYCAADDKPSDERGMQSKFELSGCKWTPELIDYSLNDVEYLVPLMEIQRKELMEQGMWRLFEKIEKPLTKTTAAIEFRGVYINAAKTKAYQQEMAGKAAALRVELDREFDNYWKAYARPIYDTNIVIWEEWREKWEAVKKDNNSREGRKLTEEAKAKRQEYKLVQPFKTPPKPPKDININSTSQMLHALEQAGIYLKNMQKATLQDAAAEHPLLELLVEYKKFEKLSQMSEIYEKINRVTSRIHQVLNQNVDTGRFSSSGPNLTNIPARSDEGARFRQLFEAEKGNVLGVADYSAIEMVIIAIRSKDRNILKALAEGLDLHCYTMAKFINGDYESLVALKDGKGKPDIGNVIAARKNFEKSFNLPELSACDWSGAGLQKWVKTFRDYVKTLTYGIAYGLSSFGLSRRFHCDVDPAQRFIDVFFSVYPDIKRWLDRQSDFAENEGYSQTASGRRRYYRRPKKPIRQDTIDEVNKLLKQQGRDALSLSPAETDELWEKTSKRLWKEYHQTINRIRRQAANHPVQGGSADITKWAMVLFEAWWIPYARKHGINYLKYGIVLTVHDELVVEVPIKHAKVAIAMLKEVMEKAAKDFLGFDANIDVKPIETPFWKK